MCLTATLDNRVGNGWFIPRRIINISHYPAVVYRVKRHSSRLVLLIVLLCTLLSRIGQAQTKVVLGDALNTMAATAHRINKIEGCPSITNTDLTAVAICSGQLVSSLEVNTTATTPANLIEYVRFDSIQANPYLGKNGVHMVEAYPYFGKAVSVNVAFPTNTTSANKVYYVYACLKPEPDISVCSPFALITVTIKPQPPKCLPVVIQRTKISRTGPR